jgi:hypothetical protein
MAKNKTTETAASVERFINAVKDETKRTDCNTLIQLIKKITGVEPKMWGSSIVGFGTYHYTYDSGREGDAPMIAFSPRASSIALYLSGNFKDREMLLEKFGKHKTDKGCVHIKTLADVDPKILSKMITNHINHIQAHHPDK